MPPGEHTRGCLGRHLSWASLRHALGRSQAHPGRPVTQYLAPCSNDPDNLKEGGELVGILRGKGLQCDVHHFADMKHGFMSRGDTKTDATIARDVQIGLEETLAFFGKQL